MPSLSVIGAQWGDEGKGKIVHHFADQADVVVRYAGGNNAGHTLVVGDQRVVVHLLPSGIVHPGKICVLGDGMVIDPEGLLAEIAATQASGVAIDPARLKISEKAHLVLPYHRLLDGLRETQPGAIGTTKRGIGPAYEDKAARRGLRMLDLRDAARLRRRLAPALAEANARIARFGGQPFAEDLLMAQLQAQAARLTPHLIDTTSYLYEALHQGRAVLFEGAQGVMLDLDHGTYPFVTSSTTLAGGAAVGAGVAPAFLTNVLGVTKAYVTRVGEGPFPTELAADEAEKLRAAGGEFGATTGRPRRCGWLDLPALRYAVQLSGISQLAVTKLDVLAGFPKIRLCTGYRLGGSDLQRPPADVEDLAAVTPVWEEIEGFGDVLAALTEDAALPPAAQRLLARIEAGVGVPVSLVSVGPRREQTILRRRVW